MTHRLAGVLLYQTIRNLVHFHLTDTGTQIRRLLSCKAHESWTLMKNIEPHNIDDYLISVCLQHNKR
jgi:hypothetical protein